MEATESSLDQDEPVPHQVLDAAKGAFSRRSSGEVATLVRDSLLDDRDPPEDHVLEFESDRFRFDVKVSVRPTEVQVAGRLAPASDGKFELAIDEGKLSFACDSTDGCFSFGPVGHGLIRISFKPSTGASVRTDWFRV